jgi:NadR type nicotinamide-nucleotide adenylyltransferase
MVIMSKTGLVIGKFYPPHRGHHYLIDAAQAASDQVHVIVCDRKGEDPPALLRAEWIQEVHPAAKVMVFEDIYDPDDSELWARLVRGWLGFAPDLVFTSEDYGGPFCHFLGSHHVQVDKARRAVPMSGTRVRADPLACWEYLAPPVRAHYAVRVILQGAESTGKSTLAQMLAEALNTTIVPEFGREYSERKIREGTGSTWHTDDFTAIALKQSAMEDEAARTCNKILVCDTDAFATAIWHMRYMDCRSAEVEAHVASRKPPTLCILTDIATPFENDGTRDGEHIREWMHGVIKEELVQSGRKFIEVAGSPDERLAASLRAIQTLIGQYQIDTHHSGAIKPCGT